MIYEALGRWATSLTLLAVLGLFGLRCVDLLARRRGEGGGRILDRVAPKLGLAYGLALILALGSRVALQSIQAFGLEEGVSIDALRLVVLESRWGDRWQWQGLAAAILTAGYGVMFRWHTAGWLVAGSGSLALAAALPLTGHANGMGGLPWAAQSIHLLGVGLWLGTLLVIVILPGSWLTAASCTDVAALRLGWLRSFAPVALTGALAMAGGGVLLASRYLGGWSALWQAAYGRLLLFKLAWVLAILLLGAFHYRRYHGRRSPAAIGGQKVPGSVPLEAGLAVLTALITSFLAAFPMP